MNKCRSKVVLYNCWCSHDFIWMVSLALSILW
jgi:hypothetical protein